ncbi:AAA family ATPase [Pseudomonadales bacterium]|nr:AAA family ATPase [Pseudomonadales bacterium]
MPEPSFREFARRCRQLPSDMEYNYGPVSPSIEYSNTGRRGKKHFSINLVALVQTLNDIYQNLEIFLPHTRYDETVWRNLGTQYFTDRPTNAQSNVQTLPVFGMIGKTIHAANNLDTAYRENEMSLTREHLQRAIDYLQSIIPEDDGGAAIIELTVKDNDLKGENVIYYGAPGTGKSHDIDSIITASNSIRMVFHPDILYSDFVGCLKPVMDGDDIKYSYRPGPFILAVQKAVAAKEQHTYLVIEEINRAPAAAVFGEIFLLLDRNINGSSRYGINVTDPDLIAYLNDSTPGVIDAENKLYLPGNLSLLATMNSSDQAVMPMDTAFKRRWKFVYKKIDFSECPKGLLEIPIDTRTISITWKSFASTVNDALARAGISEDRLLGPWFLDGSELSTPEASRASLTGKLFMYLWDDVLRHGQQSVLFRDDLYNYGQLASEFAAGKPIFNNSIQESLSGLDTTEENVDLLTKIDGNEELAGLAPDRDD